MMAALGAHTLNTSIFFFIVGYLLYGQCSSTLSSTAVTHAYTDIFGNTTDIQLTTVTPLDCKKNQFLVDGECLSCGCSKRKECDTDTGKCPDNKCKKSRHGVACVYGIISVRNDKANPHQPTNVRCSVRTSDIEQDLNNTYISTSINQERVPPTEVLNISSNLIECVFYLSSGLAIDESFTCHIGQSDGQVLSKTSRSVLYDLPILTRPLELDLVNASMRKHLTFLVHQWDPLKGDSGDGPIEHYMIKACEHTKSQDCSIKTSRAYEYVVELGNFHSAATPISVKNEYKPATTYSFIYMAKRPGVGGFGPPSQSLTLKMPCASPSERPKIHRHNYTMNLESEKQKVDVRISWQLPTTSEAHGCDYISQVMVTLIKIESNDTSLYELNGTITTLETLLDPFSTYTMTLGYKNNLNISSDLDTITINRTLPARAGSAKITSVYMKNSTTIGIEWAAPSSPNGNITEYQVLYTTPTQPKHEVACIVFSYGESEFGCAVHDVQLGNYYNFTVRAKNSVGYGDYSIIEFEAAHKEPGSITTLTNVSKTERSIFFKWRQPNDTGGLEITKYKLICAKDDFRVERLINHKADDDGVIAYNFTKLAHSTRYTCSIIAFNSLGEGEVNDGLKIYTNPPAALPPPIPEFLKAENTDTSLALEIKSMRCCSLYRVVVREVVDKAKRSVDDDEWIQERDIAYGTDVEYSTGSGAGINPEQCGKCCDQTCYIAAELPREELPMVFTIGDNKSYNGYYNPPLVTGKRYQIWYGAGNSVDGVDMFEYVPLSEPVVAREYVQEQKNVMPSTTLIGIIVAVCACAIVIILVITVFIRRKRSKMFRFRTPDSEKVLELNENGTLLPNGTYQRGDAVSVDSLDLSKQPNGEPVYDNVRLKNYPIMVEELRQYIEQKSSDDGFKREYNRIPWGLKFSHEVAKRPDNKPKNRYGNIIAYDHSRVILKGKHPEQDTDYINASYIDGYTTPKEYIATQGPTKFTVNDLWYMAWQEGTAIIVMVTNTIEQTRNKCEQYWPEEGSVQYGHIKVTLSHERSLAHYKIRTFTMEQNDEIRTIKQFHFTAWPDHGTPLHATTLLSFLKKVRQQKSPDDGPIICHCSAGVGRSGTFIALDSLLQQAESEGKVDVYGYVTQMRKQRCNMIQTLDQYIFLHDAILEASEGFDTSISIAEFKSEFDSLNKAQSNGKSELDIQYQKLQELLYIDRSTDASSKENQAKNRYANVIPFNIRRVKLIGMASNYINATFVDDYRTRSALIATQHPLTSTIEDFWRMTHTQKPFAIVTLCAASAVDECTDKQDLPRFWPTQECRTKEYTSVSVELLEELQLDQIPTVTKQSLTVNCKSQTTFQPKPVDVDHYICDFWPSQKSLPSDTGSFLKLVAMLERRKQENDGREIVINCFDGAKQSGLYIACHSLLQQTLISGEVDIPETVKIIRNDQPMFIPSLEQFQFCYEFVTEYLDGSNQNSAVFTCL